MHESEKAKKKRPVIDLPLNNFEKLMEGLAVIAVIFNILLVALAWKSLPTIIPTHFGAGGAPDAWGGKGSLLFLPVMNIMLYFLLTIVSRYPHTFNYPVKITAENAEAQYKIARYLLLFLKTEIVLLFTYILWGMIEVARGNADGLGILFLPIFMLIIFGTVGIYFYKASKSS